MKVKEFFGKQFLGCLFLFSPVFTPLKDHSNLTIYCNDREMILIEARNTDLKPLFMEIIQKLNREKIRRIENDPPIIYLYDSAVEGIVREIIPIAKTDNYAIFYGSPTDDFCSLTRILFLNYEARKGPDQFPAKAEKIDEGKSLASWLETIMQLNTRKESLEVISKFLTQEEKRIFLGIIESFMKDGDFPEKEGEGVDPEIVKKIAEDTLQEFFTGLPKPGFGR